MWQLTGNRKNPGESHILLCNEDTLVGRRDSKILLSEDNSVSRKHAVFSCSHPLANVSLPDVPPILTVKDVGAKYRTFVNDGIEKGQHIPPHEPQILHRGDRIRFGVQWNEWRVEYVPLVVTTSFMTAAAKCDIEVLIVKLGGHMLRVWSPACTHLVMDEGKLSVKTICALAAGCPIITTDYLRAFCHSVENGSLLPVAADFVPQLKETTLADSSLSLHIQRSRSCVFSNKMFVFPSQMHHDKLAPAIILAGGVAIVWKLEDMTREELCQPHVVVMDLDTNHHKDRQTQEFLRIIAYLKKQNLRSVSHAEIGLAVLYCSADKYCNPAAAAESVLLPTMSSSESQALANSKPISANPEPTKKTMSQLLPLTHGPPYRPASQLLVPATPTQSSRVVTKGAVIPPSLSQSDKISPQGLTPGDVRVSALSSLDVSIPSVPHTLVPSTPTPRTVPVNVSGGMVLETGASTINQTVQGKTRGLVRCTDGEDGDMVDRNNSCWADDLQSKADVDSRTNRGSKRSRDLHDDLRFSPRKSNDDRQLESDDICWDNWPKTKKNSHNPFIDLEGLPNDSRGQSQWTEEVKSEKVAEERESQLTETSGRIQCSLGRKVARDEPHRGAKRPADPFNNNEMEIKRMKLSDEMAERMRKLRCPEDGFLCAKDLAKVKIEQVNPDLDEDVVSLPPIVPVDEIEIRRPPRPVTVETSERPTVRNFKLFRKASVFTGVPRMLGGRDLVANAKIQPEGLNWATSGEQQEEDIQDLSAERMR